LYLSGAKEQKIVYKEFFNPFLLGVLLLLYSQLIASLILQYLASRLSCQLQVVSPILHHC